LKASTANILPLLDRFGINLLVVKVRERNSVFWIAPEKSVPFLEGVKLWTRGTGSVAMPSLAYGQFAQSIWMQSEIYGFFGESCNDRGSSHRRATDYFLKQ